MRYQKGERTIKQQDVIDILNREGTVTANVVANELGRHYFTARNRMEELVDSGILEKVQYKSGKNTMRLYKVKNEFEQTPVGIARDR